MTTLTQKARDALTPESAVQILVDGNKRFVKGLKLNRNLLEQAKETSSGQYPFAIILSCIDSRTSSELIFDQGLGDIFSCRIAGNVINEDILGSMEFASKASGVKLIMVLGHTECGAIKGACDNVQLGHLSTLLDKVKPAIEAEKSIQKDRSSQNSAFVKEVTEINVKQIVEDIPKKSQIIKSMVESKEIAIVGGLHNIATGVVELL